jgi:serine/threonine protein kinase
MTIQLRVARDCRWVRLASMGKHDVVLSGRYRLGTSLGSGGMADVYHGTDQLLERVVAIKVLPPKLGNDPAYVWRFRREAQAAAGLSHPNLVGVFDTGSDDGRHYIVMEYVEGRSLEEALATEGRVHPPRAAKIGAAVAEALSVVHGAGLVHRDVKPANIMLTQLDEAKLTDFGIARSDSASITQTGTVFGTAAYISPEQARGETVDARSDLYSLGVVLYELLTGEPPFGGGSAVAVAARHVSEPPRPPSARQSSVPPAFDAVIMRALAKDPRDRYQNAEDLRQALSTLAGPGFPAADATERIERAPTVVLDPSVAPGSVAPGVPQGVPPKGRRAMWAVAFLATVVMIALAVVFVRALLGGEPGRGPERDAAATTPSSEPDTGRSVSPSTQATPTPPATSGDPAGSLTSLIGAVEQAVLDGVAAGEVSDRAASQIARGVEKALRELRGGDPGRAAVTLEDVTGKVERLGEQGEISSPDRMTTIAEALEDLRAEVSALAATGKAGDEE